MTPREEDKVHDLMGRISRGTLSRACVERALQDANRALEQAGGSDLESIVRVYEHVLRHGEFKRNPGGDWREFDSRAGRRSNPQLQIIENPGQDAPSAPVRKAVERFHGTSDGDVVLEYESGDEGDDKKVELAYLGHCPFVAWIAKGKGAKRHSIDVEGEEVAFVGHRQRFSGESRPVLALRTDTNEAVIVGGNVKKLKEHCSRNGVLGDAPVVEYVAEAIEDTTKGDDIHYVHEFGLKKANSGKKRKNDGAMDPKTLPRLEWDDEIEGLVYRGGAYVVTDWFHK